MAGSRLAQLAIVILDILLVISVVILFVVTNTDLCGNVFETGVDISKVHVNVIV